MRETIVSASRRTDIPAFYSAWFLNRLRLGWCHVPNPFNRNQVATVSLSPWEVDAFVFWTRNPRPLMKHLDELRAADPALAGVKSVSRADRPKHERARNY